MSNRWWIVGLSAVAASGLMLAAWHQSSFVEAPLSPAAGDSQHEVLGGAASERLEGPWALETGGMVLIVSPDGALELLRGPDRYPVVSSFSYPGEKIGYHRLVAPFEPSEAVSRHVRVQAASPVFHDAGSYILERSVMVEQGRFVVKDTLRNQEAVPIGILVEHVIRPAVMRAHVNAGGLASSFKLVMPENPVYLLPGAESALGVVAVDTVLRVQIDGTWAPDMLQFGTSTFGLPPHGTYTFEWWLYPLGREEGYFELVNRVRGDWGANFQVLGPFDFFDVTRNWELLHDPKGLERYLARKALRVVALNPWLDYDHFDYRSGLPMGRDSYEATMREAYAALKQASPEIVVLGNIQSCLVTVSQDVARSLLDHLPPERRKPGIYKATAEEMQHLRGALGRQDGIFHTQDGYYVFEVYYPYYDRDPEHANVALGVYAEPGNSQFEYWMDQAKFLLDDVGLDGIYIDQFSMVLSPVLRFSYDKWDGRTVDIDPLTGRVRNLLTDAAIAGAPAQQAFAQHVLGRGKVLLANTMPQARELQSLSILRFIEAGGGAQAQLGSWGGYPAFEPLLLKAQLGPPVALGYHNIQEIGKDGASNLSQIVMQTAIRYLRHGVLYYLFFTEIPEEGPGSGEYSPLNHMYPITPVRVGPGYVEGLERVVTAVSGTFSWRGANPPTILAFGMDGRPGQAAMEARPGKDKWEIDIQMRDWNQIVILEPLRTGLE